MANKKKPAKPAKKAAKIASRKPERSKGELSSDDLESVAGGLVLSDATIEIKGITSDPVATTQGTLAFKTVKLVTR
jgi:hypothetical protein